MLDFPCPVVEDLLGVELGPEAVAVSLQLLAFDVVLPATAENILNALHVGSQLAVNLLSNEVLDKDERSNGDLLDKKRD